MVRRNPLSSQPRRNWIRFAIKHKLLRGFQFRGFLILHGVVAAKLNANCTRSMELMRKMPAMHAFLCAMLIIIAAAASCVQSESSVFELCKADPAAPKDATLREEPLIGRRRSGGKKQRSWTVKGVEFAPPSSASSLSESTMLSERWGGTAA